MSRKLLLVLPLAFLVGLAAAGLALAGNGGIAPPDPASPSAERVNDSYWFIAIFTGLIFLIVEGALIVFIVRFRRRGRPRTADGPQIHGSTRLELIWTVAPVVFLAAIGSFLFYKLPGIKDVPAAAASERLNVTVEGRQFYWQFVYPQSGVVAVDRLRVPVDQVVALDVTAPEFDVIHSWWIPELGGKIDAIPGKVNHTWFRAMKEGVFRGQCAELCGLQHAAMFAAVEVMPKAEFERWLADRRRDQQARTSSLGKETFEGVCLKCHRLSGERLFGPSIGGSSLLQDEEGLRLLVQNGRGRMPAVATGWPDEQLDALVAYARTVGGTSGG